MGSKAESGQRRVPYLFQWLPIISRELVTYIHTQCYANFRPWQLTYKNPVSSYRDHECGETFGNLVNGKDYMQILGSDDGTDLYGREANSMRCDP